MLEGWRRALRAPGLVLSVWALTAVVTFPLAAVLRDAARSDPESTTAAVRALEGWYVGLIGAFAVDEHGNATMLARESLGATAGVATVSRILDGGPPTPALAAAVAACLGLWVFVAGGTIDRLARARPLPPATFVALSGRYFLRLLRLAVLAALAYWLLFRAAGMPTGLHAGFALLVGLVSLVVDFTAIRLVIEDRRSVLSALAAGLRFVRRRFWRVLGVYGLNVLALTMLARVWILLGTSTSGSGWTFLLLVQLYVALRIVGRLAFLGSEATFFQRELAHADYTAAPLPTWPDSVSVEAIRNLRRHG